jgi:hypothetical protein
MLLKIGKTTSRCPKRLPGDEFTRETRLPCGEYTTESWLPCDEYLGRRILGVFGQGNITGLQRNFLRLHSGLITGESRLPDVYCTNNFFCKDQLPGVFITGESRLPGDVYTRESWLHRGEYNGESRLTGGEYTGESITSTNNSSNIRKKFEFLFTHVQRD